MKQKNYSALSIIKPIFSFKLCYTVTITKTSKLWIVFHAFEKLKTFDIFEKKCNTIAMHALPFAV